MNIIICFIILLSLGSFVTSHPYHMCKRSWEKVGCYHDPVAPNRPYPFQLVNHRDPTSNKWDGNLINWNRFSQSLHRLACICANRTRAEGYKYFGLQFYGECWSGPSLNFNKYGPSKECIGNLSQPCNNEDTLRECVGKGHTNYIYKLLDEKPPIHGKWSEWGDWGACSKSCECGIKHRERKCNAPKPQNGGRECKGLSKEYSECNNGDCPKVCDKQVEIGILLDFSGSVRQVNWNATIDFVIRYSKGFMISPAKVHFGVLSFSHFHRIDFKISNEKYWNRAAFEKKVKTLSYRFGYTNTDIALKAAKKEFFCDSCGNRKGALKYLLVFTDGKSNGVTTELKVLSDSIKKMGVEIISVGTGYQINHEELEEIATDDSHVFYVKNYAYLMDSMNAITKLTCGK